MRRWRPIPVPTESHPLVKELYVEMNKQQLGTLDLCDRSGVNPATVKEWRSRVTPHLVNLEACLNVVGRTLRVVRINDPLAGEYENASD